MIHEHQRNPRFLAFTLVELLVVIAVIAVIAAILFPAFAQVRRNSQVSVCLSNLHQLGQGIEMYTADWDGGMPFAPDPCQKKIIGSDTSFTDPVLHLTGLIPYDVRAILAPYGCNPQLYHCPLDRNWLYDAEPGHKPTWFEECGSSYEYDAKHALLGQTIGGYQFPPEDPVMGDYSFFHIPGAFNADNAYLPGLDLLFADFHVKTHSWNERSDFLEKEE